MPFGRCLLELARPGFAHYYFGIGHAEARPLHVALRGCAGHGKRDSQIASGLLRHPEPVLHESRLDAACPEFGKGGCAKEGGQLVFRDDETAGCTDDSSIHNRSQRERIVGSGPRMKKLCKLLPFIGKENPRRQGRPFFGLLFPDPADLHTSDSRTEGLGRADPAGQGLIEFSHLKPALVQGLKQRGIGIGANIHLGRALPLKIKALHMLYVFRSDLTVKTQSMRTSYGRSLGYEDEVSAPKGLPGTAPFGTLRLYGPRVI